MKEQQKEEPQDRGAALLTWIVKLHFSIGETKKVSVFKATVILSLNVTAAKLIF